MPGKDGLCVTDDFGRGLSFAISMSNNPRLRGTSLLSSQWPHVAKVEQEILTASKVPVAGFAL